MNGGQKIVFATHQHVIGECHTRRNEFGNAALYQLFCQFRVFQLVANGHSVAGTDEARQIGVECMVWEAGHLSGAGFLVVAICEGDTEHL